MKKFIFPIFVALLMQTAITEAQTGFVQTRYIDAPSSRACSDCLPPTDGVTHIRFDPASVGLTSESGKDYVTFTMQIRRVGGNGTDVGYISAAGFRLRYDNTVFGDNLNAPAITEDGSANSQCSYARSSFFTDKEFLDFPVYALSFRDTNTSQLNINEAHGSQTTLAVRPGTQKDNFALLGETWENYLTLTCEIPAGKTNNEAGIGIAGSQPRGIFYRKVPDSGTAIASTAFLLADNDLRGLRLDGRTWAEDYARYGDGTGVRLKFSKGIQTQLTAAHFTLDDITFSGATTPTIGSVLHNAGDSYANVVFSDAVSGGILRLVSTSTTSVSDVDGGQLVDGNFLAALFRNADAPVVDRIVTSGTTSVLQGNNHKTLRIIFTGPINAATVDASDICVTEANGLCVAEGETPTVPVVSASRLSNNETQEGDRIIGLVINEGNGKIGGTRSVEFRRNAVLSSDFSVIEDYQTELRDAIMIADTQPPVIRITEATAVADDTNPLLYTINFTVTADEPVPTLPAVSSYVLKRLDKAGTSSTVSNTPTITGDNRRVTIEYMYTFSDEATLRNTAGFTLVRSAGSLLDTAGKDPVDKNGKRISNNEARLDPDNGVAITDQPLSCAAFYPYVNQTELFLRVKITGALNEEGFTYQDDGGTLVEGPEVEQISSARDGSDTIYIVKITRDEIGNVGSIDVSYTPTSGDAETATCRSSTSDDFDKDGVVDITDSNPFDENVTAFNPAVGGTLASAPAEIGTYYSRTQLIRSLVRGEEFSYYNSLGSFPRRVDFTADDFISSVAYFGIGNSNARAFNIGSSNIGSSGSECRAILTAATAQNIVGVDIAEHCGADITDQFGAEPIGMQSYAWVIVEDGRLASSPLLIENVNVLPEINFSGQSSYLFSDSTRRPASISAYVGNVSQNSQVRVQAFSSGGSFFFSSVSENVTLSYSGESIVGTYNIGRKGADTNLAKAEGAEYWLWGNTADVWHPTTQHISVTAGGRDGDIGSPKYVIGPNNSIKVQVAAEEDEQIVEIHQILLYNISNAPHRAGQLIPGLRYAIVADYTAATTVTDSVKMTEDPDDYTSDETPTAVAIPSGDLDGDHYTIITFEVNSTRGSTRTIVVGWDNIGNISNVKATYIVVGPDTFVDHLSDSDFDNIPDHLDKNSSNAVLQSAAGDDTGASGNILQAAGGDKPLFMSDAGRNMAIVGGDYSSANIDYDEVSGIINAETAEQLQLQFLITTDEISDDTGEPIIERLATFGVRDISRASDDEGQATGGIAYVVFPMQRPSESTAEILYLSKYNSSSERWERFERGTIPGYDDTWYAIDRGTATDSCPTDIEHYINQHKAIGDDSLGFEPGANGWNCILVAVTDGGPYDSDGAVNSRVVDPVATTTDLLGSGSFGGGSGGGGGGGAIGITDVLLLITALLMLIATARRRHRNYH